MASCLLTIAPYHTDEREHIIEYPGPKCYKRPSNLIIQQSNTTQENIQSQYLQGSFSGRLRYHYKKIRYHRFLFYRSGMYLLDSRIEY